MVVNARSLWPVPAHAHLRFLVGLGRGSRKIRRTIRRRRRSVVRRHLSCLASGGGRSRQLSQREGRTRARRVKVNTIPMVAVELAVVRRGVMQQVVSVVGKGERHRRCQLYRNPNRMHSHHHHHHPHHSCPNKHHHSCPKGLHPVLSPHLHPVSQLVQLRTQTRLDGDLLARQGQSHR